MKYGKEILDSMPIKLNKNIELNKLQLKYLKDCIETYTSESFNENLEFNFRTGVARDKLERYLYEYCKNEMFGVGDNAEVRLIIIDKNTSKMIGLIILHYNSSLRDIEIGYYIDEAYRQRGIMSSLLNRLITIMDSNINMDVCRYRLKIQETNTKSIGVANKLNFNHSGYGRGKHCRLLIYTRERKSRNEAKK